MVETEHLFTSVSRGDGDTISRDRRLPHVKPVACDLGMLGFGGFLHYAFCDEHVLTTGAFLLQRWISVVDRSRHNSVMIGRSTIGASWRHS